MYVIKGVPVLRVPGSQYPPGTYLYMKYTCTYIHFFFRLLPVLILNSSPFFPSQYLSFLSPSSPPFSSFLSCTFIDSCFRFPEEKCVAHVVLVCIYQIHSV